LDFKFEYWECYAFVSFDIIGDEFTFGQFSWTNLRCYSWKSHFTGNFIFLYWNGALISIKYKIRKVTTF